MRDELIQDLTNMEAALCRLEDDGEIWQNKIIKALCRAVYHLLVLAIRRKRNENTK